MTIIEPRTENEILTEQDKHVIRESVRGCMEHADVNIQAIVDVFGLKDGELAEICK